MSKVKSKNLWIVLLIAMISFFVVGCKNKSTPVDDISFSLSDGEQIVLLVGESLEMGDGPISVSIKPTYATNQEYSLTSFDESIVKIQGNTLIAVSEGETQIKVVSDDNELKEDLMSVVVRATKTTLNAPRNLDYNFETQTFSFDAVPYASSYTIKINGEEILLGNSNTLSLSELNNPYNKNLIAQVKANAPSYTRAFESSTWCDEFKIYQAGNVNNVEIKDGILKFQKPSFLKTNVYIDGERYLNETDLKEIYLNALNKDKFHAGATKLEIETVIPESFNKEIGIEYYNSSKKDVDFKILDVPVSTMNLSTISWQNIPYCSGYEIYVGSTCVANTITNHFNLESLTNLDELIEVDTVYDVKVNPKLEGTINVGKTNEESVVKISRVASATVTCYENDLIWDSVNKASSYAITLKNDDGDILNNASTTLTNFSMFDFGADNYVFIIQAVANSVKDTDDVYYIPSKVTEKAFNKKAPLSDTYINDYDLIVEGLDGDNYRIEFDENSNYSGSRIEKTETTTDLSSGYYTFNAGERRITVTRLYDDDSVNSNPFYVEFTQLKSIENITIHNGIVTATTDNVNGVSLVIEKWNDDKEKYEEKYTISENETMLNTTDNKPATNYLDSGEYKIYATVAGDGISTFGQFDPSSAIEFTVLDKPTLLIDDKGQSKFTITPNQKVEGYDVYLADGTKLNEELISSSEYEFDLGESEIKTFKAQAIGDGEKTLDSIIGDTITVERLSTPTLTYNNATGVVTKSEVGNASAHEFKIDSEYNTSYDFASKLEFASNTTLTLTAIAVNSSGSYYYLNSLPFELNLIKISNETTISLNEDNNIEITPTSHNKEYELELVISLNSGDIKFNQDGNVLKNSDGSIKFEYGYNAGKYTIKIIDDEHNPIITNMDNVFSVKARFIEPSTGNDILINSEYSDIQELEFVSIDGATTIEVNSENNNQIVITPTNQTKEYGLIVVINDSEDLTFKSNGTKLISSKGELSYSYDSTAKVYNIDILNDNYQHYHNIEELKSDFNIKVKFTENINANTSSVFDSNESENASIAVNKAASLTRDGQNLKITNPTDRQTYTYANYGLVINNKELFTFEESDVVVADGEGYFTFNIQFIYNKVTRANLEIINSVSVVTFNKDTEVKNLLAVKSEEIFVEKAPKLNLTVSKDNDSTDNSLVLSFETEGSNYVNEDSKYYLKITDDNAKEFVLCWNARDYIDSIISFKLDDLYESAKDLTGLTLSAEVYLATNTNYTNSNNVEVFNSDISEPFEIERVSAVSGLMIKDNKLKFNTSENVAGYEVYSVNSGTYTKLNDGLILTNSFDLFEKIVNGETKEIVVKSISNNGYANSAYSASIKVNKPQKLTLSYENGKFKIQLNTDIVNLLFNNKVQIEPVVVNKTFDETNDFEIKNSDDIKLTNFGTTLLCEPYIFLKYSSDSILKEELSFQLKISQSEAIDGTYYLNTDILETSAYGLFAPTNVKKLYDQDGKVEQISWTASTKNSSVSNVGYVIKIEWTVDGQTNTYYSTDPNLKYYDESEGYLSYGELKNVTSTIFPAAYNDNGIIKEFNRGTFKISVQAVPKETTDSRNLCSSAFSTNYEFEILAKPTLSINEGEIHWSGIDNANKYEVKVYKKDEETPIHTCDTTNLKFDFTSLLNTYTGILRVEVQAINTTTSNKLNSLISEPVYVYRLPEATEAYIDDGNLVFKASQYFKKAKIEFVDKSNTSNVYDETYDNSENLETLISALGVTNWKDKLTADLSAINTQKVFVLNIGETLNILGDKNYTINITLFGNTPLGANGFASSSKATSLSEIEAFKLEMDSGSVSVAERGVFQFGANDVYSEGFNYSFNNGDTYNSETALNFWKQTTLFKIFVTYGTDSKYENIYAVDYNNFVNYFGIDADAETINEDGQYVITKNNGLFAYVIYKYEGGSLYFNVYKDNQINLKDYDLLPYYKLTKTVDEDDGIWCACDYELKSINIAEGGSFSLSASLVGGDSNTTSKIGYLNSSSVATDAFVRYGTNVLLKDEGKIKFKNLKDETLNSDNPIYKIIATQINSSDSYVFYLYYKIDDSSLGYVEDIAELDETEYKNPVADRYFVIENAEQIELVFDMSEYLPSGSYSITIQTLVGFGGEADVDYCLDSKTSTDYPFFRLTNVAFTNNEGILEFAQSYYNIDSAYKYWDKYEVNIAVDGVEYIYNIDRTSEGVSFDDINRKVSYILPKTLPVKDSGGNDVIIEEGKEYQIKIRATLTGVSTGDLSVLRGTYPETATTVKKALGIVDGSVKIENGVLVWETQESSATTVIKIESNAGMKFKDIEVVDDNSYEFEERKYDLELTGSDYIHPNTDYKITICVKGDSETLNSNYSETITIQRLAQVSDVNVTAEESDLYQNFLTWTSVANAVKYEVEISGSTISETIETDLTTLDISELEFDEAIEVTIKAIGSSYINSMLATFELTKLNSVGSIEFKDRILSWSEVSDASAYLVTITGDDLANAIVKEVETNLYDTNFDNLSGEITIKVQAIGEGKFFNSDEVVRRITEAVPAPVSAVEYLEDEYRYKITILDNEEDDNDFLLDSDKVMISYTLQKVSASGGYATEEVSEEVVNFEKNGSTYTYYYPLSTIAAYSNVHITVKRSETSISDSVSAKEATFMLFSYGAGTSEDPYAIKTAQELFNIETSENLPNTVKFSNGKRYYQLASSINLSSSNIGDRLESYGAVVSNEFDGVLDGQAQYSIYGFGGAYANLSSFALFNNLNGAIIRDLFIGVSDSVTEVTNDITNSSLITSSDASMKVSILANNSTDSTISGITIQETIINITSSLATLPGEGAVMIAGLVNDAHNSTISHLTITGLTINIEKAISENVNSYIGGAISRVDNSQSDEETTNVENSEITFTLESNASLDYVGGAVGRYVGKANSVAYGIENTIVNFNVENVKTGYVGGLIGFARYIDINNSETLGKYSNESVDYSIRTGGLVGEAQSSIIENSGSGIEFVVTVSNSSNVYVGAVVGYVWCFQTGETCKIIDCYWTGFEDGKDVTTYNNNSVVVGTYGRKGSGVTIGTITSAKNEQ